MLKHTVQTNISNILEAASLIDSIIMTIGTDTCDGRIFIDTTQQKLAIVVHGDATLLIRVVQIINEKGAM